ncbi:adenosylmethionine decarboxylase [Pacificoceanicola onchidii]|uniref:adenosylmethionine decarboxylase n=1 Tax=Pacificoceanicola onchidii TaxID=2562685 RepID=UPI001F0F0BB4|nr:adenosylmethionine decarboxylase [Pacificoceanicola onchidii]
MKDTPLPEKQSTPDHFAREDGVTFAGKHLIVDVVGGAGLDDETRVRGALREAALACGATILHLHTHRFSPQGITGVAVLAESHITVHTWPEVAYAAFDIFMCGDAQPDRALPVLAAAFETDDVRVRSLRRGENVL